MRNAARRQGTLLPDPGVNGTVLCSYLDITTSYLSQLVKDKILFWMKNPEGVVIQGRFDLKENVVAYVRWIWKRAKAKPSSAAAYDLARTARMREAHKTMVIRNQLLMGNLLRADDVDAEVIAMVIMVRDRLLALPAHAAQLLLGKENPEEIITILTEEITSALRDFNPIDKDMIRSKNRELSKYVGIFEGNGADDSTEEADSPEDKPRRGRPRKETIESI